MTEKSDRAEWVAEELGRWRDTRAAVFSNDHGALERDIKKMTLPTIHGMEDMLSMVNPHAEDWERWTRLLAKHLSILLASGTVDAADFAAADEAYTDYQRWAASLRP